MEPLSAGIERHSQPPNRPRGFLKGKEKSFMKTLKESLSGNYFAGVRGKLAKIGIKRVGVNLLVFLFMLGFTLYAFRGYMVGGVVGEDYIWGGDGMAHVYKVAELTAYMKRGIYVDWSDMWYLGYHPYHFYSPLSYVIYAGIAYLVGDVGLGIRIGVASSFLMSMVGMYLVAWEIIGRFRLRAVYKHLICIVASIYYSYHPYPVNFLTFVNDLPAAFAFSFFPFAFYLYLRSLRGQRLANCVGCAVFLALTFLAHPYPGFFAALAMGLHLVLRSLLLRKILKSSIIKEFMSMLGAGLLFLGLIAFWIIPYYYASGVLAQTGGYEWTIPIASVEPSRFFDPSMKSGWSPAYLGLLALSLLAAGLNNRKRIPENLIYIIMLTASAYMALGVHAPLSSLNPLLHVGVYPDRAIILAVFCLACGLASAGGSLFEKLDNMRLPLKRKLLIMGLCTVYLLSTIVDSSSASPSIGLSKPQPSFNDVCYFIRAQGDGDGRVLFIGPDAPLYSYSPALTGRGLAGGYYLQGSKIAYWTEYCRYFALKRNETAFALNKYKEYNVEYIVVDRRFLDLVNPLTRAGALQVVYENSGYIVYRYLGYEGIIQSPPPSIFIIGNEYPASVVKGVLEDKKSGFTVTVGRSPYVDDYSPEELLSHDVLVLYSFTYHDKAAAESLLRDYVEAGKLLVVDMDGFYISWLSVNAGEFLGVNFSRELIYDEPGSDSWGAPLNVTYSALPVDNSFSKGMNPDGSPWYGVVYEGFSETLVEVNGGYKVVGVRDGVYFVGLNLFYHALLYNNSAEISLLRLICKPREPPKEEIFTYQVVKETPYEKVYRVVSNTTIDVLVSIAWSPHLKVTVNGEPATVVIQDLLIRLRLPKGENYIRITYVETPIHIISQGITLATIILLCLVFTIRTTNWKKWERQHEKWDHTPQRMDQERVMQ